MKMPDATLTHDRFLGGKVMLWQPKSGYRAGVDPVLLAASVPATPGQSVLELGCGVGAAALCLGARVADLDLFGVELQPDYAELAQRNATENGQDFTVTCADLTQLPPALTARQFDHVIANPPYYLERNRVGGADAGRETALTEETPLADWVGVAAKRLKPKGMMTFIQDIERLPEMMAAIPSGVGSIEVWPMAGRAGRAPNRFLMRARKQGRARFVLHATLAMHLGDHHVDGDTYDPRVGAVLRDCAELPFPAR